MGKFSRDKGARFERWVARKIRDRGHNAERKRQSAAYDSEADVEARITCPPRAVVDEWLLSIECKDRKTMPSKQLADAWGQAVESAEHNGRFPVVVVKLPGTSKALAVLDFDTLLFMLEH